MDAVHETEITALSLGDKPCPFDAAPPPEFLMGQGFRVSDDPRKAEAVSLQNGINSSVDPPNQEVVYGNLLLYPIARMISHEAVDGIPPPPRQPFHELPLLGSRQRLDKGRQVPSILEFRHFSFKIDRTHFLLCHGP